ncbi:hypothetical protein GGQ91_005073 [Methylobacterium fujisawaense]|uniref:DUF302 domain-containing protein n=1 Tax=Methylobacterium fujisawaense TaxID=107400 RepID=A0ABR6DHU6_9HYPH|nr:hypothetical protein [Methylobacterium fujisawaense]MBA9065651.1 hypothetical protein [Methylobacterium fujisawaense]
MTKPFDGARIKIERAKHHLQSFEAEVAGYFERGGAQVVFEMADEYTEAVGAPMGAFVYRESEPRPDMWSAMVGDIVHNLRASLDLMATDLHRISGGDPKHSKKVHYPFCNDRSELNATISARKLNRIDPAFREIIDATAPFKGGNDGLYAVHQLDILDKHQTLVPTLSIVQMDWPVPIVEGDQKFGTCVAMDGQRLMLFPPGLCPLPIGSRIPADVTVVFDDVDVFRGIEIVPQLAACIRSVEHILNLFKRVADQRDGGEPSEPPD